MTDSTEIATLPNPPNPETPIPRYNFKLNQNLNMNLYREIPRVSRFGGFRGCSIFSGNCHGKIDATFREVYIEFVIFR